MILKAAAPTMAPKRADAAEHDDQHDVGGPVEFQHVERGRTTSSAPAKAPATPA